MTITDRRIAIPDHVRLATDKKRAATGYIEYLMGKLGERFLFWDGSTPIPRVEVDVVGTKYLTINYVRDEDESLIARLRMASVKQLEMF